MRLSRKWLNEFVPTDVSDKEYADVMTMSGSKVETVTYLGAEIINVVAGRIISVDKHPNADKLSVCLVDIGKSAPVTIVTGALNVNAGDLVPVALDGSTLPDGKKINSGELRGVISDGMLCSLKELGLTTHDFPYAEQDGIFIMREECKPGQDIREILGFDDSVFEFEITNNRADCFSVIGLARETAAAFKKDLTLHTPVVKGSSYAESQLSDSEKGSSYAERQLSDSEKGSSYAESQLSDSEKKDIGELLDIEIHDADLCPRYTARMVKNVKIAPSPSWLRERLRASGVRPISNIVDITNYVMLEYGQPMHAFDFACVTGGKIIVRRAYPGEKMETLDGTKRELSENMLVIADETRPIGVAGVMGGANSEITENTEYVVFESANFNGPSIRQTALALGMRTDASSRFEKGLDPMQTLTAVQRACELVELLGAGEVIDGVIDVIASDTNPVVITLDDARINKLLGTSIDVKSMCEILVSLGFSIDGNQVTVPSWRRDVIAIADLAEEVARFYGYNNIPSTLYSGSAAAGGFTKKQTFERKLGMLCRALGYSEIMTYSFISPGYYDRIHLPPDDKRRDCVTLLNPIGEETSIMRTTALPSMLDSLGRNYSFRNKSVKLYEIAPVYKISGNELPFESKSLIIGAYGEDMDFFALKGILECIACEMNLHDMEFTANSENPSYHPGRCADIYLEGKYSGVIGQIHPSVAANFDIGTSVYALELSSDALYSYANDEYEYVPLPRFPALTRDIAVICEQTLPVALLSKTIKEHGGKFLTDVKPFDIYTGGQIGEGKKSAAFSLKFSSGERTLTDADADMAIADILDALRREHNAALR